MLRLAQRVGFTVPTWRLLTDAAGMDALVLSRFDRLSDVAPETAFDARPVEDAAQVMGLWPADKYNVTSEDLISSVSALTAAPAVTRLELFRRFVFALLTGNGDLHAKNVSVIQDATGRWQLAPYYDFPSTLLYDDLTLALPIQGRTDDISRKRLLAFADAISLPERLRLAISICCCRRRQTTPSTASWSSCRSPRAHSDDGDRSAARAAPHTGTHALTPRADTNAPGIRTCLHRGHAAGKTGSGYAARAHRHRQARPCPTLHAS